MSTVHPIASADAERLRSIARGLSYNGLQAESAAKHVLFEIAMRLAAGLYAAPATACPPTPQRTDCACVPGTCRGGQVVDGVLLNGWQCRACKPAVPAVADQGPETEGQMGL